MKTYTALIAQHELKAMAEMVIYARSIAQVFPDKGNDMLAAKLKAYAQTLENLVERIESATG
jgi:hypothetical protein